MEGFFQQISDSLPLSIFAVDLPSGFIADRAMDENYPCLKADHVFTFEIPKTGLLFPASQKWLNDFSIVKIDLDKISGKALILSIISSRKR